MSEIEDLKDPEWLEEVYRDMTQQEIADEIGCSRSVVSKWMTRYEISTRETKPIEERFWERVDKGSEDECWEWEGTMYYNGYGQFWNGERELGAHRFSKRLDGEEPGELQVNHHCDNRSCVNPAHLYIGTQSQNMKDAWERSR